MKIEKNFNGKVSFKDLIQKSREENLPLIEVVKEYTQIHRPSLEEKIVKKSILISNYTKQESIIQGLMTAEITEENVSSINEQINEIRSAQEVMTIFTALNLFNEKIEFDTELENSEVFNQYNILFQEGVFNYFHTLIGGEWEVFISSFNRDVLAELNSASVVTISLIVKELTKDLNKEVLNDLKIGLDEILVSDSYKRVLEVVDKIN